MEWPKHNSPTLMGNKIQKTSTLFSKYWWVSVLYTAAKFHSLGAKINYYLIVTNEETIRPTDIMNPSAKKFCFESQKSTLSSWIIKCCLNYGSCIGFAPRPATNIMQHILETPIALQNLTFCGTVTFTCVGWFYSFWGTPNRCAIPQWTLLPNGD